jgi:hypothetical protein
MNLFSYEEDEIIVRPVAADFMELAGEVVEDFVEEDFVEEEEDFVEEEEIKETPLSDEEKKELERHMDIVRLRLFLQGKYVFEEGETLAAFDAVDEEREFICTLAYNYVKYLEDYEDVFANWSLDDATEWVFDRVDLHIGVLNAAEILAVVNMMISDMLGV